MQELLHQSVRELEKMKIMAMDMAKNEPNDDVNIEEISAHFNEAIKIKKEEFWATLSSCNESLTTAKTEEEHTSAYNSLKNFLDTNVLYFSEESEEFQKFQMIYESFYSALNEMEGEVSEDAIEEALASMLSDIKKMQNLEDIAQLKIAINSLEDIEVQKILLDAIAEREREL